MPLCEDLFTNCHQLANNELWEMDVITNKLLYLKICDEHRELWQLDSKENVWYVTPTRVRTIIPV
jgi:hypothetical protein